MARGECLKGDPKVGHVSYGPSFCRARNPRTPGKSRGIFLGISSAILLPNDFPGIFRASSAGHFQEPLQGAGARPPARPPARCTVATASRWRVRRCLKSRGGPPSPRGAGCPEDTTLGTIARKIPLNCPGFSNPVNPASKFGSKFRATAPRKRCFGGYLGNPGV